MNGLLSSTPSPGAIRLVVGGYLLMVVEAMLLLLAPSLASDLRVLIWLVTLVSGASLIAALCGFPTREDWRRVRGRR